jgi:hypothetical protein
VTESPLDHPRYIVKFHFDGNKVGMSIDPGMHIEAIGRPLIGPQEPPFSCGWSVHTVTSEELPIDPPIFYFLDEDSAQRFATHLTDSESWPGEAEAQQRTTLTGQPETAACDFRLADGTFPDLLPETHRHLMDWESLLQLALFHHYYVAGKAE